MRHWWTLLENAHDDKITTSFHFDIVIHLKKKNLDECAYVIFVWFCTFCTSIKKVIFLYFTKDVKLSAYFNQGSVWCFGTLRTQWISFWKCKLHTCFLLSPIIACFISFFQGFINRLLLDNWSEKIFRSNVTQNVFTNDKHLYILFNRLLNSWYILYKSAHTEMSCLLY